MLASGTGAVARPVPSLDEVFRSAQDFGCGLGRPQTAFNLA